MAFETVTPSVQPLDRSRFLRDDGVGEHACLFEHRR
jgi:hypothetical protein